MKVLIIPDVHLKSWIFHQADTLVPKNKYDRIVCLGDICDDWNQDFNLDLYKATFEYLLDFDKNHPDTLWCYGNHDISYLYHFIESGFSDMLCESIKKLVLQMQTELKDRLAVMHRIDNVLFSHAGLTADYVEKHFKNDDDIDSIINKVNGFIKTKKQANNIWQPDSPIWERPQHNYSRYPIEMYKADKYWQIIGHSPTEKPEESVICSTNDIKRNKHGIIQLQNFLSLDTFSTTSQGDPIGDQRLVIIDTKKHKWEYAHPALKI